MHKFNNNKIFDLKKLKESEDKEHYWVKLSEPHKPWFCSRCKKAVDQNKQAKLQWLQDLRQINEDNLNSVRREAGRHFGIEKKDYLKEKISELATHSMRYLHRGVNVFKNAY
jgi:hypothetical protein